MSASRSSAAGSMSWVRTAEKCSRAVASSSGSMDSLLGVVDCCVVGGEDLPPFGLVLRGEQAVVDAERLVGEDHPADLLVVGERGVGQGEPGGERLPVGGDAGRGNYGDQ